MRILTTMATAPNTLRVCLMRCTEQIGGPKTTTLIRAPLVGLESAAFSTGPGLVYDLWAVTEHSGDQLNQGSQLQPYTACIAPHYTE